MVWCWKQWVILTFTALPARVFHVRDGVLLTQGSAYSSGFLFVLIEMPENLLHRSCRGKLIWCHLVSAPAYPYHVPVPSSRGWQGPCRVACDRNSWESGSRSGLCHEQPAGWLPAHCTASGAASPALRELAGTMPALATCASLVLLPLLLSHALSVHLNKIVLKM